MVGGGREGEGGEREICIESYPSKNYDEMVMSGEFIDVFAKSCFDIIVFLCLRNLFCLVLLMN